MKILHVITRFIHGGADENTLITCNAQSRSGEEVHLIHGREFKPDMVSRLDRGVTVHYSPDLCQMLRPINDIGSLLSLVALIRSLRPDIVHTHTSKAGVIGRLAAWLGQTPMVVHGVHILPYQNVSVPRRTLYLGLERVLARITHAYVNVSDALRDCEIRHGVGRPDQHFVARSGMDIVRFQGAEPFSMSERAARLTSAAASAPLMVLTAALEPRKRQYEFLDVLSAVRRRVPNAQLALMGEGCDEKRLRARVDALGLQGAVHFLGFTDEVARWIASADVCVFASEREGLPRAVIQYVLGGRPVVCTRLPGIETVVEDGVNGRLIPVDRLDNMADPIIQILADPALAHRMAAAARARDLSAWDQSLMAERLAEIYRETANRSLRSDRR